MILMILGALIAAVALALPTTVGVNQATGNVVDRELSEYGLNVAEVANIAGQHQQLVYVLVGGFLFMGGAVLFGAGAVRDQARAPLERP